MTPHGFLGSGHQQSLQVGNMSNKDIACIGPTSSSGAAHILSTDCSQLNASCAPLSWNPRQPTVLGAESWCHALRSHPSHWKAFYYILAPTEKSSSNYWKQIYFCSVAWMLKGHCCLGPCYTTKNSKFFHIRSKSHCAIEVPCSWQMPKPIIAPTAMTQIITAFPLVKCVPCSVSYLK